jgi:hypothetical protein
MSLNQVWNKFNQILSKFKFRSEFHFSFEYGWPLVKVPNTKFVPNIPIYLQKKFHNFMSNLSIFPRFNFTSVLHGKYLGKIKISFLLCGPNPSAGPAREAKAGPLQLPLSVCLPSGLGFLGCPTVNDRSLCAAPPIRDFFPQIPLPASGCCIVEIPLLPLAVWSPLPLPLP